MSVSVHAYLVIGVPMSSGDLLLRAPKANLECPSGHKSKDENPFCFKCGGRKVQKFNETFIPTFTAYAKSIGEDPKELFESWTEGDYDNVDVENPSFGFHGLDESNIFGIQIARTSDLMYSPDPKIVPAEAIGMFEKKLIKVLSALLPDKPTLIPRVYLYGTAR